MRGRRTPSIGMGPMGMNRRRSGLLVPNSDIGAAAPASLRAAILATGPLSWYDSLDLTSVGQQTWPNRATAAGGVAATSGSAAGSDTNDPTITVATGTAAAFARLDGSNDYFQLPAYDTPTFTGTTGAWTLVVEYATSSSSLGILWSSETTNDTGALLFVNNTSGTLSGRIGAVAQAVTNFGSGHNSGRHVVGMVVTPGSPSTFKIYSDGQGLSGSTVSITVAPTHGTPRIGTRGHAVTFPFNGDMYAVLQYNRTLTSTELDDLSTKLRALHP